MMEQELTNLLELLREGLSELPTIGSDVFNIYVRGIQIEGGVKVATYVVIITIIIYLIRYFKKKMDNISLESKRDWSMYEDLEMLIIALWIGLLIVSVMASFGIYNGLLKLFAPDYMLIKEVIDMLAM